MADILWIDYEAQSDIKLKVRGIYIYARSPHTRLICASLAMNKEPARHWNPRLPFPADVARHIQRGGRVRAHNAVTERLLTNHVGHRLNGIPTMTIEQMECTMTRCGNTALPPSLEMAAIALKLPVHKDMEKQKSMKRIWAPLYTDPITGEPVFATPETHPKEFQDTYDYNLTDLEVMREVTRYTRKLSPFERQVYIIDQKINDKGVLIDMENVRVLKRLAAKERTRLNGELAPLCGLTFTQNVKMAAWIREQGVPCKSLNKNAVANLLNMQLPKRVRRVIEVRQEAAKSSLGKLPAMERRCAEDNRARGCFKMMGAVSTGRWSHSDPQFGNIPRPALTPQLIESILEWTKTRKPQDDEETLDIIRTIWGRPMGVFSDCLRGLLVPAKGKTLIGPDLVSIESLTSAWLVGDDKKVQFMANGGKVYEAIARLVLGLAPFHGWDNLDESVIVTKPQRQKGKVAELAFGYEGGWRPNGAVGTFCEQQSIPYPGEEEARRWQTLWRKYHPLHVQYWKDISRAAVSAVLYPGRTASIGPEGRRVSFTVAGRFLLCFLPSSSVLCYPYPRVSQPNPRFPPGVTYMKAKGKQWFRNSYYGGHGLENVTQRCARDLLAFGMVNLYAGNYEIVTHSHDEAVVETAQRNAKDAIVWIFNQRPAWAEKLPYTSSAFEALRYQK